VRREEGHAPLTCRHYNVVWVHLNLHPRRISSQRGATRKLCTGTDFQRCGPEVGIWKSPQKSARLLLTDSQPMVLSQSPLDILGATLSSWQSGPLRIALFGLLFADERTVDVDVVQHDHAGARFGSLIQDNVNTLHLGSRRDGRGGLRGVAGIEVETIPSGCR